MTFKEHLEKVFGKEKGYYNSYSWFEDLICNVCGEMICDEAMLESEQEVLKDGNLLTFCAKCKEIPEKIKLSKSY